MVDGLLISSIHEFAKKGGTLPVAGAAWEAPSFAKCGEAAKAMSPVAGRAALSGSGGCVCSEMRRPVRRTKRRMRAGMCRANAQGGERVVPGKRIRGRGARGAERGFGR